MSRIQKTTGVVLSVIKYSDSSKIANIYTKDFGRVSMIVKGGRQKQSKSGMAVDPLNAIEIVFYNQPQREIQTLTEAQIINHYPVLREDFDRLKYGLACVELIAKVTLEHEVNTRMFQGIVRILERINLASESPLISFLRFFLFVLEESGFAIILDECSLCSNVVNRLPAGFTWQQGFICNDCLEAHPAVTKIDAELFNLFYCLKSGKAVNVFSESQLGKCYQLLERFAAYHLPELKGLNALQF